LNVILNFILLKTLVLKIIEIVPNLVEIPFG
jgi:hypothetical protein